jgi:hypothetical protein
MRIEPLSDLGRLRAAQAGLIVCMAVLWHGQARADSVQKCRIDGRTVFQSSPCPLDPRAAATPAPVTAAAASAPDVAPARKKSLNELLGERHSAARTQAAESESQGDGAKVLRAKMGAM